jgi:DNA-binding transcriptional LysR family regulator
LTEAGRAFAEQARSVLARFDLAIAEARRAGGVDSTLRVGCAPQLPIQPLLRFLGGLHAQEPRSPTQVVHLIAREQVRRLRDGELELGIFSYVEDFTGIEMEQLFAGEPLAAFVPSHHPLAAHDVVRASDVRNQPGVIFPREANPALHDWLMSSFSEAGYEFTSIREAGGVQARDLLLAVASGLGVALLPESLDDVSPAGDIVARRPLEPPLRMPETVIAWRSSPPPQLQSRLATAGDIARELRDRDREAADIGEAAPGIGRPRPAAG